MDQVGFPWPNIFGAINKGKCHDSHGINAIFQQEYQKQIKICPLEFALRLALRFELGFALGFALGFT